MSLAAGTRLGAYEILALLGVGGMGEVYRAKDHRLNRQVALKVLPASVASDPDRLARFEREAQVLAALNHPNIAALHGVEDASGTTALLMELVEGPTLADRIARGALPLHEALAIARQIAEAVEAAHEHGIVHRDLKPANIRVQEDGTVKVLDFGLAKYAEGATDGAGWRSPDVMTASPTITSPAMTHVGVILGTAAYMSPEQARGRSVDKRTDIWAFGCVLYEMLTGTRAFVGDDVTDLLANVLKAEPNLAALPPNTPTAVKRLIARCLDKERKTRLPDIAIARYDIDDLNNDQASSSAALVRSPKSSRTPWVMMAITLTAGVALGILAAWSTWSDRKSSTSDSRTRRLIVDVPDDVQVGGSPNRRLLSISSDGKYVAFLANSQIYLKTLDRLGVSAVQESANGILPFFSPDNRWLAFFQNGHLKKVPTTGGAAVEICALQRGAPLGISWTPAGTILFGEGADGIWQVSEDGGVPAKVIDVDATQELAFSPELLEDRQTVIFTLALQKDTPRTVWDNAAIVAEKLSSHERSVVVRGGGDGHYVPTGHLVYARERTLFAVRFDPRTSRSTGSPVAVMSDIGFMGQGVGFGGQVGTSQYSVSDTGVLAYLPQIGNLTNTLVWVDGNGRETPARVSTRAYVYPSISPVNEHKVALDVREGQQDIVIWDVTANMMTPITFEDAPETSPLFSPDGKQVIYSRAGAGLFAQAADGSGSPVQLTQGGAALHLPNTFVRDASVLLFSMNSSTGYDIYALHMADKTMTPILADPNYGELNASLSPDSKWLAYESMQTGQPEIIVQPYPNLGDGRWKVSTNGGTRPRWAHNGHDLFYMTGTTPYGPTAAIMKVTMGDRPPFSSPVQILPGPYYAELAGRTYDITPDDKKFLVVKPMNATYRSRSIVVVENWFEELKGKMQP